VLIVDGDVAAARALAALVRRRGLAARLISRGDEALRAAGARSFALAVVDANLQDMAGSDLAGRLRDRAPALPVVMTTSDARPEIEVQARQAGIVHFAPKPLDQHRFDALVAKVLGGLAP
jgi:DNA-binding NtrC family response regulator